MTRCSGYRLTKDYSYAVKRSIDNGVSPIVRVSAEVANCSPPGGGGGEDEPPPDEPPPPPPPGVCWDGAGFEYPC
jgi:hypothetical protein